VKHYGCPGCYILRPRPGPCDRCLGAAVDAADPWASPPPWGLAGLLRVLRRALRGAPGTVDVVAVGRAARASGDAVRA
jgi:hypothetical protein